MSASDALTSRILGEYGPGHSAFTVVPHDTNALQQNSRDVVLRGLYVGAPGNVAGLVWTESGSSVTVVFLAVPAGTILNVAFTHIHATDTTVAASSLIGLI